MLKALCTGGAGVGIHTLHLRIRSRTLVGMLHLGHARTCVHSYVRDTAAGSLRRSLLRRRTCASITWARTCKCRSDAVRAARAMVEECQIYHQGNQHAHYGLRQPGRGLEPALARSMSLHCCCRLQLPAMQCGCSAALADAAFGWSTFSILPIFESKHAPLLAHCAAPEKTGCRAVWPAVSYSKRR